MYPHRRTFLIATVVAALLVPAETIAEPTKPKNPSVKVTVVRTIEIHGVDVEAGNPEIQVMSTGSLNLLYQVFPPLHVKTTEQTKPYETFDKQLEKYLGVPVSQEDRELFHIAKPRPDTIERVKAFVQVFPKTPSK